MTTSLFTTSMISFIQQQRVARLATSDVSGIPTLVPVCFAFDGEHFFTPLDEKPKNVDVRRLKRVQNITARPEVALLFDHYTEDWSQLAYLLVHGKAVLVEPAESLHAHALPLLRARYIQYQSMALEKLPVIVITPQRISSWGM